MQPFFRLGLATLAFLALAGQAESPPAPPATSALGCKPTVPLHVQLRPGSAPRTWHLQASCLDADRQVDVWMWSGSESERSLVWSGLLRAGQARDLVVPFPATETAWAAVETQGGGESGLRAVTSWQREGRTSELTAEAGVLLQNPETGETILQHTGHQEGGR